MFRTTSRRTGAIAALAATSLLLAPVAAAAPALPELPVDTGSAGSLTERPGKVDRGVAPANSIRGNFSAPGPRPVAATAEATDCDTLVMRVYTRIAQESQGLNKVPGCYGYAPAGLNPAGVEYVYPADLAAGETAPLDLFQWWSDVIEVPVVAEGALDAEAVRTLWPIADFIALGPEIWSADDPAAALAALWPSSVL